MIFAQREKKIRITPAIADYIFVETHAADSPMMMSSDFAYNTPHYNTNKFPSHVLTWMSPERFEKDGRKVVDLYYAAIGQNQDNYNWVYYGYSKGKYKRFSRYYLKKRDTLASEANVETGTIETVGSTSNPKNYQVYNRRVMKSTGSQELDSVYVMIEVDYILPEVLEGRSYDSSRGQDYKTYETIIHNEDLYDSNGDKDYPQPFIDTYDEEKEPSVSGNIDGQTSDESEQETENGDQRFMWVRETPINGEWTQLSLERAPFYDRFGYGDDNKRTYKTFRNHYWPPVYTGTDIQVRNTKENDDSFYYYFHHIKDHYSGPSPATITEEYFDQTLPPDPADVDQPMVPEPISVRGINLKLSIKSCLHDDVSFYETHGTSSIWENGTTEWEYDATNYSKWPPCLVVESSVSKYKDGWLRRTVTVYRPFDCSPCVNDENPEKITSEDLTCERTVTSCPDPDAWDITPLP